LLLKTSTQDNGKSWQYGLGPDVGGAVVQTPNQFVSLKIYPGFPGSQAPTNYQIFISSDLAAVSWNSYYNTVPLPALGLNYIFGNNYHLPICG
jgi:hypothetical protein